MNIQKIIVGAAVSAVMLNVMIVPAFAAGKAAPKTTGGVGYTAGGLQRYAEFNAIETSNTCSYADVTGTYVIAFKLDPDTVTTFPHDAFLTQTGSSVGGNGGYLAGALTYSFEWLIDTGTVTGNTINLSMHYTVGAVGTTMTMVGTIAPDGSLSGTWTDNFGGTRTGTWASTSGNATVLAGCTGKGTFHYSDINGDWYYANVQYVNVDGTDAYFAGLVTSASQPSWIGNWVQVAVYDGGEPAYLVDSIWGIFTDSNTAKYNVANKVQPNGEFVITSGNLQVH